MASAGFLLMAILALATWGEEPAPLNIFSKNPPPPPLFWSCAVRNALRQSKNPGSFFQHLVEQVDGVIQIFPLRGFVGLDEQQTRLA